MWTMLADFKIQTLRFEKKLLKVDPKSSIKFLMGLSPLVGRATVTYL